MCLQASDVCGGVSWRGECQILSDQALSLCNLLICGMKGQATAASCANSSKALKMTGAAPPAVYARAFCAHREKPQAVIANQSIIEIQTFNSLTEAGLQGPNSGDEAQGGAL